MEEHNPAATQINNFARRAIFRKTLFIHANRRRENKNLFFAQNKTPCNIYNITVIKRSFDSFYLCKNITLG